MGTEARPVRCTVESLLERIAALPLRGEPSRVELWVPDELTIEGHAVPNDLGMAVVLDALLTKSFFPGGTKPMSGGRLYTYVRE